MKKVNKVHSALVIVLMSTLVISMTAMQDPAEPWEVPAKDKNIKNPFKADDASLKKGKTLYISICAPCHGKVGKGDGVKARGLVTFPGDFSGDAYQGQTDGEHFYKTKYGRDEMPNYENSLADENIWHMVNYMRTFKE